MFTEDSEDASSDGAEATRLGAWLLVILNLLIEIQGAINVLFASPRVRLVRYTSLN